MIKENRKLYQLASSVSIEIDQVPTEKWRKAYFIAEGETLPYKIGLTFKGSELSEQARENYWHLDKIYRELKPYHGIQLFDMIFDIEDLDRVAEITEAEAAIAQSLSELQKLYQEHVDQVKEQLGLLESKSPEDLIAYEGRLLNNLKTNLPKLPLGDTLTYDDLNVISVRYQQIVDKRSALIEKSREEANQKAAAEEAAEDEAQALWIAEHGSRQLKLAFEKGYPCWNEYVKQRKRQEYPKFTLKWQDNEAPDEAVYPSIKALNLLDQYPGATIYRSNQEEYLFLADYLGSYGLCAKVKDLT